MKSKGFFGFALFPICNIIFLCSITTICILPFIHFLSLSLSSNLAAAAGEVKLLPKGFSFEAYSFLYSKPEFLRAVLVSFKRVLLGTVINMILVIITAYPLSKDISRFRARTAFAWFFAFTMFFSGGLIPSYIIVRQTGLINSIWSLIIPSALSVWNTVILLNFFRQVPKELEEAAIIDGAGQLKILWKVFIPVSTPALATVLLFTIIWHWNSWFDGMLYMNSPRNYPLQTYLSTIVMDIKLQSLKFLSPEEFEKMSKFSDKSLKAAQVFLGALPIIAVYPFLQRFFIKGLTIGSVKG